MSKEGKRAAEFECSVTQKKQKTRYGMRHDAAKLRAIKAGIAYCMAWMDLDGTEALPNHLIIGSKCLVQLIERDLDRPDASGSDDMHSIFNLATIYYKFLLVTNHTEMQYLSLMVSSICFQYLSMHNYVLPLVYLGDIAERQGLYEHAFHLYLKAGVFGGDVLAMFHTARCYLMARGVEQNMAQAFQCLRVVVQDATFFRHASERQKMQLLYMVLTCFIRGVAGTHLEVDALLRQEAFFKGRYVFDPMVATSSSELTLFAVFQHDDTGAAVRPVCPTLFYVGGTREHCNDLLSASCLLSEMNYGA